MYLLAMDCAGSACSVALFQGSGVMAWRHEAMSRGQSERLVPMIDDVLKDAAITPGDLKQLAVTVGPGAFTGIRIGLASARAMSLALDIPAIGVTTFDATVRAYLDTDNQRPAGPVAVVLETKRSDYYAQLFGPDGAPLTEGMALDGHALCNHLAEHADNGCVLIGDGANRFLENDADRRVELDCRPGKGFSAIDVAKSAIASPVAVSGPPRPLYLRPPDVTLKLKP